MKIIISYPNIFWDINMKCMEKLEKNIILLQYEQVQKIDSVHTIDVSVRTCGLGQDPGRNRGGRQYAEVKKHLPEILQYIKSGEDVLVLADTDPQSVIIFDLLRTMTDSKNFKLHFWGITPFRFEAKHRKITYLDLLEGNGRVKSLHVKDADDFLKIVDRRTTMPQMLEKIRDYLEAEFSGVLAAISAFKAGSTYFYDNLSERYVDANLSLEKNKEERCTGDSYILDGEKSNQYDLSAGAKELIGQPVVRRNGRVICRKLRQLRMEFAKANKIPFESKECGYEGACAGTCEKCDNELRGLYDMISAHPEKIPVYPHADIEKEWEKSGTLDPGHMMGFLQMKEKPLKELPGIQIPEFLKKIMN